MSPARPNILLIILDTLRRDRLSAYGHDRETSPEFDAFAGHSTLFERAVAPAQWTIPSHSSMFTGLYPSTHQVTQSSSSLSGSYPVLAEILRGAGYHTVAFCNNPLVGVLNNGLQRGFDRFYNYASAAPFRPIEAQRSRTHRALLRFFRRNFARPIGNQFAHSDFLFRMSLNPALVPLWTRLINYKGNTANSIDDFIDYWKQQQATASEAPVFGFLNLMGAHLPYTPPQDFVDRVAPKLRHDKHAYTFMRRFNTDAARWASPTDPPLADWERQALVDFYDAEILHQDYHLGRLLRHLKQSGALDHTMVIIAADHGEGHGDHAFFGHGFVVYQELVHVPLVVYDPERFPAGMRVPSNISTRRIFHTILEAAGVQPPLDAADPNANVAGLALHTAVVDAAPLEHDLAYAEAFPPLTFLNVVQHQNPALIERLRLNLTRRSVYAGAHKLVTVGDQVEGLFDLAGDPAEIHSVAAQHPQQVTTLRRKLDTFVTHAESQRAEAAEFAEVDAGVVDHLRALGYIE
ncbi:MAG: sulfatase [Anaerolineaceae bacterium]|nr:sulfatase [Anaerolineaceae bacterium]